MGLAESRYRENFPKPIAAHRLTSLLFRQVKTNAQKMNFFLLKIIVILYLITPDMSNDAANRGI
jgi:hypothetical protein